MPAHAMIGALLRCAALVAVIGSGDRTSKAATWSEGAGYRSLAVQASPAGKPGFDLTDSARAGLTFTNVLQGDAYLTNAVAHNGAGLAIGAEAKTA